MAGSSTLSFRVEDEIITRLDDAAADSRTSRSALAREALLIGVEALSNGEGDIEVPDHLGHDAKVRRMIAQNKAERRRGKFRSEFSKQLKRSFKNNEHPAEFESSVSGYVEEAGDMGELPEEVRADLDVDVRTFEEWVEHMLEYYRVAYHSQTFDHDPIDHPLGNHEGIETAKEWMTRAENIATAERDRSGGTSAEEKQRSLARHALEDGVVPDRIEQQARESEGDPRDAVVSAAVDLMQSNRSLTNGSDNPELE